MLYNITISNSSSFNDAYGYARVPESIDRIEYGRFRNVYLYITDKCQLRCGHCYMGDRLDEGLVMPTEEVFKTLRTWRMMGGSKLSILGGEPTLHPDFERIVDYSCKLGYEKIILNTNALKPALRRLTPMAPSTFSYIQVSLDGGSANTHDLIRGKGTFDIAWDTTKQLCDLGFDVRIICTVNQVNISDCLNLLHMADSVGVTLVKYHVFSGIGIGNSNEEWLVAPRDWINFYKSIESIRANYKTKIWYQPTYAYKEQLEQFSAEGYRGCIGRTLDRISIFPDGRAYVCSYLFDTDLNFATTRDGQVRLNNGPNEFDLFTSILSSDSCGDCKSHHVCSGGCPAEKIVMGTSSCVADSDIIPVCRLWKSEI